jgi:opacity protein-like surface antigen
MRILSLAIVGSLLSVPCLAQDRQAFVEGTGGFAVSSINTSPNNETSGHVSVQGGVPVWKHTLAFGEFGHYRDLEPTGAMPGVDSTVATLAATDGLDVIGSARMPATYGLGGARFELPTHSRLSPYVLGGIGAAHLTPSARFDYTDGTLPNADPSFSPTVGQDVTQQIISAGAFTQPPTENAFMFSLGGGADVGLSRHWSLDAGYRYSRIEANTPLNANGMAFGVRYRF